MGTSPDLVVPANARSAGTPALIRTPASWPARKASACRHGPPLNILARLDQGSAR